MEKICKIECTRAGGREPISRAVALSAKVDEGAFQEPLASRCRLFMAIPASDVQKSASWQKVHDHLHLVPEPKHELRSGPYLPIRPSNIGNTIIRDDSPNRERVIRSMGVVEQRIGLPKAFLNI